MGWGVGGKSPGMWSVEVLAQPPGGWPHVWCENSDQGHRKGDVRWGPCREDWACGRAPS